MIKKITFILSLSLCFYKALPQAWTVYDSGNSGLPFNSVHCIAFESSGLLWVGTEFGLASFDGTNWTTYFSSTSGLPDNAVRSIAIDRFNNKWIGTFLGGLAKFDGTNWTVYNVSNSGLPDDYIKTIAIDTAGNKWMGTVAGLVKFDDTNWEVFNMSNSPFELTDNVSYINIDTANVFRLGTTNGGYIKIIDNVWTVYTISNGSGIPDNSQAEIKVDQNGVEWIATPANGLVAHPGGFTWLLYNPFSSDMPSSASTSLITLSGPDRIWAGTQDAGIVRKTGVVFEAFNPNNSPMPDYYVQCINNDTAGIIWIGTQSGGLVRLDESLLTGINQVTFSENVMAFPNPATDFVKIFYAEGTLDKIELQDISGKYVQSIKPASSLNEYTVNVSALLPGIYFLHIYTTNGRIAVRKIIKAG